VADDQIKLIVGLGNPGSKYELSRHNLGFLTLDHFVASQQGQWRDRQDGLFVKTNVQGIERVFLKPQLYMNRSGVVVSKYLIDHYIEPEEMLVLHDEADLSEGQIRLKKGGGAGGHNGLRSIMDEIGSQDFYRLRIGCGKHDKMDLASFVLSKASVEVLQPIFLEASKVLEDVFQSGFVKAQMSANQATTSM